MATGGILTSFIRHNKQILPGVVARRFRQLRFENGELVRTIADLDRGVRTVLKEEFDHLGTAAIVSDSAGNIPLVGTNGRETEAKVLSIKAAYSYTTDELEAAQYSNIPLTNRVAMGARRAIAEMANKIAAYGSDRHGVEGILNNASVPLNNSSFNFFDAATTVDDVLDFFVSEITEMENSTELTETVSDILLAPEIYNHLIGRRVTGTDKTVLSYIREALSNEDMPVTIRKINEVQSTKLEENGVQTAGTNKHRIVFYNRVDEDTHERHIEPLRAYQFEGPVNGRYVQPLCYRTTGVLINFPLAFRYVDVPKSA